MTNLSKGANVVLPADVAGGVRLQVSWPAPPGFVHVAQKALDVAYGWGVQWRPGRK